MCGILGLVGSESSLADGDILAMRDTMSDRGPDASGFYRRDNVAFAHRRLSIRDLNAKPQPWVSSDQTCVLVFNGEIYNDGKLRQELEAKGYAFRSRNCDTEVVLTAYQHWGEDFVTRLEGMFALGIYDFPKRRLILARDRFGIKPLFFRGDSNGLIFASSIAAILRHPHVGKRPNWSAVSHYLTTFRLTLARETLFAGIHQLLPAERLIWEAGQSRIERYWNYPAVTQDCTFEESTRQFRSSFSLAVRKRMVSDVPVGMFLSGGVDSNTIACFVRNHVGDRDVLGGVGGGDVSRPANSPLDDFMAAGKCAQHVGFDVLESRASAETYWDTWRELITRQTLPLATPSDVIIHHLSREMKRHVGVVLGGEGADELLGGYEVNVWSAHDFDRSRRLINSAKSQRLLTSGLQQSYGRVGFASLVDHYFAMNSLIPSSLKASLFQPDVVREIDDDSRMIETYQDLLTEQPESSSAEKYMRLLHRVNLESLLSRLDAATMSAGLEARVPFTDHKLVETMFRIPLEHKIRLSPHESVQDLPASELSARGSLESKRPLRQVASELMPRSLAFRPKASFPTPVRDWIAGPWQERIGETLRTSEFAKQVFQPQVLDEFAENLPNLGMWTWPILNVIEWGEQQFAA